MKTKTLDTSSNTVNNIYKNKFYNLRIESKPELNAEKLIKALEKNNYSQAKELGKKIDVNGHRYFWQDFDENTPLTHFAKKGNNEAIKFLIEELGANPNVSCDCPEHRTPLHYAVEFGHISTVELLLNYGANPSFTNSLGERPIDLTYKNPKIASELKQKILNRSSASLLNSGKNFENQNVKKFK
jgi:ankyrin repeat protein